jgi:hypothetical protein
MIEHMTLNNIHMEGGIRQSPAPIQIKLEGQNQMQIRGWQELGIVIFNDIMTSKSRGS